MTNVSLKIATLLVCVLAAIFIDPKAASAQDADGKTYSWGWGNIAWTDHADYLPTIAEACAEGNGGSLGLTYKAYSSDPENFDSTTGVFERATCHFDSTVFGEYEAGVGHLCRVFNADGSFAFVTGNETRCVDPEQPQSCSAPENNPSNAPVNANNNAAQGNPIYLADLIKVEKSNDWTSPKDSRFNFVRTHRSSDVYNAQHSVVSSYGFGWAHNWVSNVAGHPSYVNEFYYNAGDGVGHVFKGSNPTPEHAFLGLELDLSNPDVAGLRTVSDGSGKQYIFGTSSIGTAKTTVNLRKVVWPDGYSVSLDYSSGLLNSVSDNRGQRAEYTFGLALASADSETVNRTVIKSIAIDMDYDGATFNSDVVLDYAYKTVEIKPNPSVAFTTGGNYTVNPSLSYPSNFELTKLVGIDSVSITDVANTATTMRWAYDYQVGPAASLELTKVYDGRDNGSGEPTLRSEFFYDANGKANVSLSRRGSSSGDGTRGIHLSGIYADNDPDTIEAESYNELDKKTTFTYREIDGMYRATKVDGEATTHCLGTSKELDYTPNAGSPEGFVYSRTERNGAITTYTRDARGLVLTKTEDSTGLSPRITTYQWHTDYRLPVERKTSELQETFTYDTDGLLTQYEQKDVLVGSLDFGKTRVWNYTYTENANGVKLLASADGPGLSANGVNDVTSYTYDADGNLASVTQANGYTDQITSVNDAGLPTHMLMADGQDWTFTYDIYGNILTSTLLEGGVPRTTTYTYDEIQQLISLTNTLGKTWSYSYNQERLLATATDPSGSVVVSSYDAMGNLTKTEFKNPNGLVKFRQETSYDKLGRVHQALGANSQTWEFAHDKEDNLVTITDPQTLVTTNNFDALNKVISVTDRDNGLVQLEHDDDDQLTKYTDQRGIDTDMTYNGFGDLLQEVSVDRGTMSYSYDERGLVTSMTDARGEVITYAYDNMGRILSKSYASDSAFDQTFTYDYVTANKKAGAGKLRRAQDNIGYTWVEYKKGKGNPSRITSRIDGISYAVAPNFDSENRLEGIKYPSNRRVYYTHNQNGRVSKVRIRMMVTDANGNYPPLDTIVSNMAYKPWGPLGNQNVGDGLSRTLTYDVSYRLTAMIDTAGSGNHRDITLGYDTRDDLTSITDNLAPAQTETLTYTNRQFLDTANGAYGNLDYNYDAVGNRTSVSDLSAAGAPIDTYLYPSDSNKLSSILQSSGSTRNLTYDAAGNVISDSRLDGIYTYTYDVANRMSSVSVDGALQAEYEYNFLGQQVIRKIAATGQTIHNIFDLDGNRIAEYDYDDATNTSTLIREYIWANGVVVAVVENNQVYYVRTDHIGRPVFATNGAGSKVWEASYKPFGGVDVTLGGAIDLRFPGQWFQAESGLHQNWMRDYDPTTGRYVQADPLGLVDGSSVYGYAMQSPYRYIDPTGLSSGKRNSEYCESIKRKMENIRDRIRKREQDLIDDPWGLPERDNGNPLRNSKHGHRVLIQQDWNQLRKLEDEYAKNCTDDDCDQDGLKAAAAAAAAAKRAARGGGGRLPRVTGNPFYGGGGFPPIIRPIN